MTRYKSILGVLLLSMLLTASFSLAHAYLGPDSTTTVTETPTAAVGSVPAILWLPFVLGFIAHWFKKYKEDTVTNSFVNYFTTGVTGSISAVVGGFVSFVGLYSMNPAAYPNSVAGYIGVFLISFTWDSLSNGPGKPLVAKGG
jgi:hypothetical protein